MDLSATKDCHCLAARKRAREITRLYDEKLRPHGLQSTQFSVLAVLGVKGPTPLGELADILGLERTSLTRSANRLEDDGWVTDAESDDARVRRLKLTATGREKVESAYPAWKEAQDEADEQMDNWLRSDATTADTTMTRPELDLPAVVSRDEWRAARIELLEQEKELTRKRDELNAERRRLPMVEVDEDYVFEGPDGEASLLDLFDGRRQLVVYHFMFDPEWDEGCKVCSLLADNIGHLSHLHSLDTSLVMVSRAPYDKLEKYRARMGWSVPWYSSYGTDFNYDFHVTLDASRGSVEHNYRDLTELASNGSTEAHGTSVFLRDGDDIYHTYSSYERGNGLLVGTFNYLDLTPLGRHEHRQAPADQWDGSSGNWLSRHDEYDE